MTWRDDNYQTCSICGVWADDGGLYENKFTCHDCLDELRDELHK